MEPRNQSVTVMVLAAGGHFDASAIGHSCSDPGFLNVGTKLAIERIALFFQDKPRIQIKLAVNDADKSIFSLKPFANVTPFSVGRTSNVCNTIEELLKSVDTDWCLINPITTVPTSHLSSDGALYFGLDQIPRENWSAMTMRRKGEPVFHRKTDIGSYGLPSFPFTGRIYARTDEIRVALREMSEEEYFDLLNLGVRLFERGQAKIRYERWLDAGHSATYADSKLLSISSRFFNQLTYNKTSNTILKCSTDSDKLRLEGKFYEEAAPSIKRYFPVVIRSSPVGSQWELEMEYIGLPSLAEVFLYGQIGYNNWRRIILSLRQAFDSFYAGPVVQHEDATWLYSGKTLMRQEELEHLLDREESHPLNRIYTCGYKVNDFEFPSLREVFELTINQVRQVEGNRALFIGHGDLCFNNILVDPLYGSLKLIDPKAAVHHTSGQCGLMDPLYDLAKLNHSFCGLYDSVVNNLYYLDLGQGTEFGLRVYSPPDFRAIISMFQDMLLLERIDEPMCNLITVNLFLSMLPLHQEDPSRMLAFSIIGSCLLLHGTVEPLLHSS